MRWCQVGYAPATRRLHRACPPVASVAAVSLSLPSRPVVMASATSRPLPLHAGWEFLDSCNFPAQVSMEVHYKSLYMWTGLDNRDTWRCAAACRRAMGGSWQACAAKRRAPCAACFALRALSALKAPSARQEAVAKARGSRDAGGGHEPRGRDEAGSSGLATVAPASPCKRPLGPSPPPAAPWCGPCTS